MTLHKSQLPIQNRRQGTITDNEIALIKSLINQLKQKRPTLKELNDKIAVSLLSYQVNLSIKDIEKSLTSTQSKEEDLKEQFQMEQKVRSKDLDALNKKIADLERRLKQEAENNTTLEQYTLCKNLRFNNIEEEEHKDSKVVVYNIQEKELGVNVSNIRFHAVLQIGKKTQGKCRPSIARFLCRQDRYRVWSVSGKLKESFILSKRPFL